MKLKKIKTNCLAAVACLFFPLSLTSQEPVKLRNNREIFVDYFLIEKLNSINLVKHAPIDEGPVLYFDNPWEGIFSTYTTIIKDNDIYRAYYRGGSTHNNGYTNGEFTCYAESKDGIKWIKPNLRLYEVYDTFENNIVVANEAPVQHNFSPFLDKNPKVRSDQKYKALGGTIKDNIGLIPYASPDGIHWKKMHNKGVITKGKFDSQNATFCESNFMFVIFVR